MCCCLQGKCVSVGVTTLTVTANLTDSSGSSTDGLEGNTTIRFSGCWANYTDLSVVSSGTSAAQSQPYLSTFSSFTSITPPLPAGENLTMTFSLKDWAAASPSFSVRSSTASTLQPASNTTAYPTSSPPQTPYDPSIFNSSGAVSAGILCVISAIFCLARSSDVIPT